MTRRKIRDHQDAAEQLDAFRASGQSLAEFCRARGLDGRSLNCWRNNLERGSLATSDDVRLVEVAALRPRRAVYRIVMDDLEVEVDDHFREDTLARLLAVVAAC